MLFSIEFDSGVALEGYIVPDGFSEVASIRVSDENNEFGVFQCDQARPAVVAAGRHQTGLVGFRLDQSRIPVIRDLRTLMIHDAKSGVLIYRRPQVEFPIQKKIIRLETQILPMAKFDRHCGRLFSYELHSMERFGHETTLQAFHLDSTNSIYLSGRLLMRNYEHFLDRGFEGVVLLSDPYYELALRLFLLKRMVTMPINFLGERDQLIFGPAAEYFADTNFEDEDDLRARLKKAPPKVTNVLSSPIIRQLVCASPEQRVTRREVAPAIDLLSRFTVVGHNSDAVPFQSAVSELLGIPLDDVTTPSRQALLEDIARKLRRIPAAEMLLEEDLIFDHYVVDALLLDRFDGLKMKAKQHVNTAS